MFGKSKKKKPDQPLRVPVPDIQGDFAANVPEYLHDPYTVAALTIRALDHYSEDHDRCFRELAALKGPLRLLPRDREVLRVSLEGKSFLPRSFYLGAEPDNGYTPELPLTVLCDENPLALLEVDILKISVHCSGDPIPRALTLRRRGDLYSLWDYAGLLPDIAMPSAEWLRLQAGSAQAEGDFPADCSAVEEMNGLSQFPIGCWTYYSLNESYPDMVKDWAQLGLTNPLTPEYEPGMDKKEMLRILDECASYGMEVFVRDTRTLWKVLTENGEPAYRRSVAEAVADFGGHPAVKGFYIGDEPDAPDAADAFAACRICRESAPNLCPYLNLLPWFDWIGPRIGSEAYAPYLDRAAIEGNLKLLAYDCYTQMWDGDSGYDVYFNNLREHSEAARRNNIEFCSTLLSIGHYDYRCPSMDDFRWQLSTAAAFGAKSVAWFYVHQRTFGANYRQPPINVWNERTTAFEWLSAVDRQFQQQFGSEMMRLNIADIGFAGKAYGGAELFKPCDKILGVDSPKGLTLLFNRFTDAAGKKYAVLVNVDAKINTTANIHLAKGVKLFQRTFEGNYQPVSAINDAVGKQDYGTDGSTASLILAPGQMELLRYED